MLANHWSLMSLHDIVSLFFHIAFCHQIDLAADRIQCQNLKVNSKQIGKEEKKEELQKITASLIMLFTLPQSVLFFSQAPQCCSLNLIGTEGATDRPWTPLATIACLLVHQLAYQLTTCRAARGWRSWAAWGHGCPSQTSITTNLMVDWWWAFPWTPCM